MTKPTEAMKEALAKAIGYRDTYAEHALRAILAAPQDYGLGVLPTRSQLVQVIEEIFSDSAKAHMASCIIRAGYATEDPTPEPAPVPPIDLDALRKELIVEISERVTDGISAVFDEWGKR
jgi:hypothetical protein